MGEWISVKDRLPDNELNELEKRFSNEIEIEAIEVIVMIAGGEIATTYWYDGKSFTDDFDDKCNVTCWMSLPEPPKI